MILTTTRHLDATGAILRAYHVAAVRVDDDVRAGQALSNKVKHPDRAVQAGDVATQLYDTLLGGDQLTR